jgi:spore coat protein U-like protein
MIPSKYSALSLVAGMLAVSVAQAATTTTQFNVTATVKSACTVNATALNFGTYDPSTGTNLPGNSTVDVRCTRTTPFTVALNAGGTGSFANRLMVSGANSLQYNLFTTAALTTVWGDGTAATGTNAGTGTGVTTPVSFTVYGSIPSQPTAVPGAGYTDTVTVTVNY